MFFNLSFHQKKLTLFDTVFLNISSEELTLLFITDFFALFKSIMYNLLDIFDKTFQIRAKGVKTCNHEMLQKQFGKYF